MSNRIKGPKGTTFPVKEITMDSNAYETLKDIWIMLEDIKTRLERLEKNDNPTNWILQRFESVK